MKALLRGYIFFKVNGEFFWSYENARSRRIELCQGNCSVSFMGWNPFLIFSMPEHKGWRSFYIKSVIGEL